MALAESPEDALIREEMLSNILGLVDPACRDVLIKFGSGRISEKRAAVSLHVAARRARIVLGITGLNDPPSRCLPRRR